MGNPITVQRIRDLKKNLDPDIIFLMETKNPPEFVMSKIESLNFASTYHIPPHSPGGGGLTLLWNSCLELNVISSCDNFIDTEITYKRKKFYATFTYGAPEHQNRRAVLQRLTDLSMNRDSPWFLTGDFNDIVDNSEKEGGPIRAEGTFVDFRTFMSTCDLFDLRHSGNFLSWRGVRHTHTVNCRLDRAISNSLWAEAFPSGRCSYLEFEGSDHRPLISYLEPDTKRRRGIFRYDRRLCKNEEVRRIIAEAWTANRASVEHKIAACRRAISKWNREHHENSQATIKREKNRLEEAMTNPTSSEELICSINSALKKAYKEEEDYWRQRSRTLWLALGDRNTGFFHATTRVRRAINKFAVIETDEGDAVYEEPEIIEVITKYYSQMFTTNNTDPANIVEEAIRISISEEDSAALIKIPTPKEIKEALFSVHPDKAPGPDGFSAGFFRTNWTIVGPAMISEITEFFRQGTLPNNINHTHLRLIPKITAPKKVADYRPIALTNVYYKIISKIITRRMQPILDLIISENQSAFVPGRSITDNIMITHETLHFLKRSGATKHCSMAVKTDMSKAYDRLEWSFIKAVLRRFGFQEKFCGWVMSCITSVTYSILFNGEAQGMIRPTRGIRQGDPLSPYIFILCSEVLSGLCAEAQRRGSLAGVRVA